MKTAILISGHMRTFDKCLATQHWHVFRHFPGADFFVSTVKDADSSKAELLRAKYPNARVEIEVVDEQPDCVAEMRSKGVSLPLEWHQGRPYMHEPYAISVHPQAVLRQLWQLQKCWELFRAAGMTIMTDAGPVSEYDVIIRCRPDLWFHSCDLIEIQVRENNGWCKTVAVPGDYGALIPYWGGFGGRNDRFAVLGVQAAEWYFTTYSRIPQLMAPAAGCALHPESLIGASLENCNVKRLFTEFSTLRTTGELRPPEINAWDIARLHA